MKSRISFAGCMKPILAASLFLVVCAVQAFSATVYGHTIIALYKSTENQTATQNEIAWYLAPILEKEGFSVRYWDADHGTPTSADMRDVRAIVSWFRGSSMSHPLDYLAFLNRSIDEGRKIIVLGNLGVYQDRDTGEYLQPTQINPTLERLGLIYLGDWTENGSVIRIASVDDAVAQMDGPQRPDVSRFFYHFTQVDRNMHIYLSLRRTDRDYAPSPVIVTNRNGGFALSSYIYREENSKLVMMLDLSKFVDRALFPDAGQERVALLVDSSNSTAMHIKALTQPMLMRNKIPVDVIDAGSLDALMPGDLRQYTAVGLLLSSDAALDPAVLKSYLQGGGDLVVLMKGDYSRSADLLAMGSSESVLSSVTGYRFTSGFALGEGYAPQDDAFTWSPGSRPPAKGSIVLATGGSDQPSSLLWAANRFAGKVLVWNWNSLEIGDFQGLILESFLYVRPVGITATPGLGIMYIDDFPEPMYNVVKPPESITDTKFYSTVWWPQIRDLFANRNIPFTTFTVFNYNANTSPPFPTGEFYVGANEASVNLARAVLASGNELGLHGYNHMSLTLNKTATNIRPWPSIPDMEEALKQAHREWSSLFGSDTLPFSYVAPNNIISSAGVAALHEAFPSIHVVCALRYTGGDETATSFGPDPKLPGIYFIPRNSWGYEFSPGARMRVSAAVSGAGIWAHFIHPDDVFDPNRSRGLSWNQLVANFGKLLDFAHTNYPWLKYTTVKGAYQTLEVMDESEASFRWTGGSMMIHGTPGLLVRVRTNLGPISDMKGVRVVYQYSQMPETILQLTSAEAELDFIQ
ncbi:MAG TPA: DUF2194 domain-containing protein [Spirochaetia bacterium]|nr:DUF2194 domain-containing protein [Spirochaetia bacterium]